MQKKSKKEQVRIIIIAILVLSCFIFTFFYNTNDISFAPGDLNESVIVSREISPIFLNQETSVQIHVQVLQNVDNLIVAEIVSDGFEIQESTSPANTIYSTNLVTWFVSNVAAGNYSFNYTFVPKTNNGQLRGKVGVSLGQEEASFTISGQSNIEITTPITPNSKDSPGTGSGGGSSGNLILPVVRRSNITIEEMNQGKSIELAETENIIMRFDINQEHKLTISDIQKNYATLLIESNPIKVNLIIGQSTKLDLNDDKIYDLYVFLNKIESNKATLTIKKISEKMEDIKIDKETPANININFIGLTNSLLIKLLSLFLILVVVLIIFFLFFYKKTSKLDKRLTDKARILVAEYRKKGYNRGDIEEQFIKKGWSQKDIDSVL